MIEKLKHFEVILESVQKIQKELDDLKGWINLQIYEVNESERKGQGQHEAEPRQNESYEETVPSDRRDFEVNQFIKTEILEDDYPQEPPPDDFEDDETDEEMLDFDQDQFDDNFDQNEPSGSNPLKRQKMSESLDQDRLPNILNGIYFSLYARKGNLLQAKCTTCGKILRGSMEITSNFIKHLRRMHPSCMKAFEKDKEDSELNDMTRKKAKGLEEDPGEDFDDVASFSVDNTSKLPPILCNTDYFKVVQITNEGIVLAQCLLCSSSSSISKIIKGSKAVSSNFITHLQRLHKAEWKSYVDLKPRRETQNKDKVVGVLINGVRVSTLFDGQLFSFFSKDGHILKAKCSSCNKIISGSTESNSNFFKHLRRMHPSIEYDFDRSKEEK